MADERSAEAQGLARSLIRGIETEDGRYMRDGILLDAIARYLDEHGADKARAELDTWTLRLQDALGLACSEGLSPKAAIQTVRMIVQNAAAAITSLDRVRAELTACQEELADTDTMYRAAQAQRELAEADRARTLDEVARLREALTFLRKAEGVCVCPHEWCAWCYIDAVLASPPESRST